MEPARRRTSQAGSRAGLLYHAGGLGDFVLSLSAVMRVRESQLAGRWAFWGPPERLSLLPGFELAPPELSRFGHTLWGEGAAPECLEALRGFGVIMAFGGDRPPPWVRWAWGRVFPLAAFPVATSQGVPVHQASQLDALGVPANPGDRGWSGWREQVLPHREPREIILHPGSGDRKKNVPASTWARVVRSLKLASRLPVKILVGPAENERGGAHGLEPGADGEERSATLRELLGVLARARLFVGNDSGAAHLAAALGVPTLAVFGPSDPRVWRPRGPRVALVSSGRPCAPCSAGGRIACDDPVCLAEIEAPAIAEAALELLEG